MGGCHGEQRTFDHVLVNGPELQNLGGMTEGIERGGVSQRAEDIQPYFSKRPGVAEPRRDSIEGDRLNVLGAQGSVG